MALTAWRMSHAESKNWLTVLLPSGQYEHGIVLLARTCFTLAPPSTDEQVTAHPLVVEWPDISSISLFSSAAIQHAPQLGPEMEASACRVYGG